MLDVILAILAASAQPAARPAPAADPAPRSAGAPVSGAAPSATALPPGAAAAPVSSGDGLTAEPQTATGRFTTALEVRPVLAATQASWIHVRDFDGQDLLYVTHLWSWRCGLVQIRLGVNGGPLEVWPLPECHLDAGFPNMITAEDGLPYRGYPAGSIRQVTVELTYDDLATESVTFARNGQPQP